MMEDVPDAFKTLVNAQLVALRRVLREYPVGRLIDASVRDSRRHKAQAHRNPLLRHGEKFYSQNDEDGILLEICRRIGLAASTFLEFGVGNGLENNTLILLMSEWRGAWVGGQDLQFAIPKECRKLTFSKSWITVENAFQLYTEAARRLGIDAFDLLSVDMDGNDLHILQELLRHSLHPSIVIVEYNGKFPPPIRFTVAYNPQHTFDETDYCGASLQSFVDLLEPAGYDLVACNITGLNAFFVDRRFAAAFDDVPTSVAELFVPADYASVTSIGHPPSPRTVLSFLRD
jgi:hypothetical protein